jgi:DeoR/GlpR family transcriptional regulator of sugar metabolism
MNIDTIKTSSASTIQNSSLLFAHERRQQIAQLLGALQRVTVPELSQLFSVSEVTIRKDLTWLEAHKLAVRTHGGAILASSFNEVGLDVREPLQRTEKECIGAVAAGYVQHGETIALDASTTALAMIPFLKEKHELTVVTNGLRAGMDLINTSSASVLILGGMLRQESFSLVGTWGTALLQQIHIGKVFVSARGFTLCEGLTDANAEEVELKRAIVEAAKEVIAIIDHSKWRQVAFATFCPLDRIKLIITDMQAPTDMIEQVRENGINVLQVHAASGGENM